MMRTEQSLEDLTLTINQEIQVHAPLDITSAALLEQLGPANQTPDGKSLNMKIEPWPGGRWWNGTEVVFDISPKQVGTEFRFTHAGLVPDCESLRWPFRCMELLHQRQSAQPVCNRQRTA